MIRTGLNTTAQNTAALVPQNILIDGIKSPLHRGKRFIEINSAKTVVSNCEILDVQADGQDAQGICVLNSTGDIEISDNWIEADSENIMVGGDTMKIPNTRPTNIRILRNLLEKPLIWKEQGVAVKNHLELKDGHQVLIQDLTARNCWASGQDGYSLMFTPSNGASLRSIRVVNANISNVGGICNIAGIDGSGINKERTQIRFDGGIYRTNKAQMGGRGCFALLGRGPEYLDVFDCDILTDGTAFIIVGDSGIVDRIQIENCRFNLGKYGISINGEHYGGNTRGVVRSLIIRNNVIMGANSTFKKNFPENVYG